MTTVLLNKTSAAEVYQREIFFLQSTDTVKTALELLVAKSISSCPVFDATAKVFLGVLSLLDIAAFLARSCEAKPDKDALRAQQAKFAETKLRSAFDGKQSLAPCVVAPIKGTTVLDCARLALEQKTHRVWLTEHGDGGVVQLAGVVSLSNIVEFLSRHLAECGGAATATLADVGIAPKDVVSIDAAETTLAAVRRMCAGRFEALPVVDDEGLLLGNLACHDLKALKTDLSVIYLSAEDTLKLVHKAEAVTRAPLMSVQLNDSVQHCIGRMVKTHVHRLYLKDAQGKLCGVVTQSDLMHSLLKE